MSGPTWRNRNSIALVEALSHAFCETVRVVVEGGVDVGSGGSCAVGRGAAPDVISQKPRCLRWRVTRVFHGKRLLVPRRLSILGSSSLESSNIGEAGRRGGGRGGG